VADRWEKFRANRAALTAARQVLADEDARHRDDLVREHGRAKVLGMELRGDVPGPTAVSEAANAYVADIEAKMPRWQRY
jgi:hypothetical protein